MATTNVEITKAWSLAVTAGADCLLSLAGPAIIEIAVSDTATDPTIDHGHVVSPYEREAVSRAVIGPGHIYWRIVATDPRATVIGVVTAWT